MSREHRIIRNGWEIEPEAWTPGSLLAPSPIPDHVKRAVVVASMRFGDSQPKIQMWYPLNRRGF